MPEFRSLDSLFNYINKNIQTKLPQLTQQIEQTIKDYIMERHYSWQPSDYSHTYQYVNSLTVSKIRESSDGYEVELYFDTSKIQPLPHDEDRRWNKHMDMYGNPVNEFIPLWLEEGTNNPYYSHPGNHAIRDTYEEFKNGKAVKELLILLKSKGFNCTII
jgi:hypothetical protein